MFPNTYLSSSCSSPSPTCWEGDLGLMEDDLGLFKLWKSSEGETMYVL